MSVILMYHSIGCGHPGEAIQVRPATLVRQLRWVAEEGLAWASLGEVLARPAEHLAAITFDDGFADILGSLELLRANAIPATLFVCPDLLGGVSAWTTSPATRDLPLLSPGEVRRLAAEGVEIAPHGWTHQAFTALGPEDLARDLRRCNAWFAGYLGFLPELVAYPYGRCAAGEAEVVAELYDYGIAVEPLGALEARFAVPRVAGLEGSTREFFRHQLGAFDLARFLPVGEA